MTSLFKKRQGMFGATPVASTPPVSSREMLTQFFRKNSQATPAQSAQIPKQKVAASAPIAAPKQAVANPIALPNTPKASFGGVTKAQASPLPVAREGGPAGTMGLTSFGRKRKRERMNTILSGFSQSAENLGG